MEEDSRCHESANTLDLLRLDISVGWDYSDFRLMGLRSTIEVIEKEIKQFEEAKLEADEQLRFLDRVIASYLKRAPQFPGFVYLLRADEYYKIGKAGDVNQRTGQIRLQLPFAVTLVHYLRTCNMHALEGFWHRKFAAKRMNGEWFKLTDSDIADFCRYEESISEEPVVDLEYI